MGKPKEKPTVEQVLKLVEELHRNIQIGLEQAERGELMDGDEVFRLLRERNAAMSEKGSP